MMVTGERLAKITSFPATSRQSTWLVWCKRRARRNGKGCGTTDPQIPAVQPWQRTEPPGPGTGPWWAGSVPGPKGRPMGKRQGKDWFLFYIQQKQKFFSSFSASVWASAVTLPSASNAWQYTPQCVSGKTFLAAFIMQTVCACRK